jgi:hypothetical protein
MNNKLPRMNKLSDKIAKKTGLSIYEADAILKVAAYELVEILRQEQRFNWEGLGVFKVVVKDCGLIVSLRLHNECFKRLNKKDGERSDEIVLE